MKRRMKIARFVILLQPIPVAALILIYAVKTRRNIPIWALK